MRGFWGATTLVLTGVILANLVQNWQGTVAGVNALNNVLKTAFSSMLGYNPNIPTTSTSR
jgi:hypothetical protein